MNDCIFCKILAQQIPSVAVWEDEQFIAILDVFPSMKGMTLLIPKKHVPSDPSLLPEELYQQAFSAARYVMEGLKQGLGVTRVALVCEGMGVDHFHIKLYPLHGVDAEWKPIHSPVRVWCTSYPGFLTTQMGPAQPIEELKELAIPIRQALTS